jgi:antitoxin (DNA-binding transcriptional repressor) of toxin-antitoxin stability system
VRKLSATEAARHFSSLLDQVEHDGETFVVERRGRVVATITPATVFRGKEVKQLLREHPGDADWAGQLADLRAGLSSEDRNWTG